MKLTLYEIKKVISQKVFITILVLSLLMNGFILSYTQLNKSDNYKLSHTKSYSEALSEYSSLSTDKATQKVKDKLLAYEILSDFQVLATTDDERMAKDSEKALKEYKKNNPQAYAEAEKMSKSGEDFSNEKQMLEDISDQLEYIQFYPDFINEMDERAERQSKAKLFNDENSFSYKNLFKTADDYRALQGTKLEIGKITNVLTVGEYKISDYLVVAIIFLMCIYLFSFERDKGLYNLVRSTRKGRLATILSKLVSLGILTFLVSVVFTLSNFAVSACLYGFDTMNVNIQSFAEFRNCTLPFTVGEYYLVFILSKASSMLAFSGIFALFFGIFTNAVLKYIACGGIVGGELALYFFISADSPLSFLKYINLFYFSDTFSLLSTYLNLNVFSFAVNILTVAFVTIIFILVVSSSIVAVIFVKCNQQLRKNKADLIIESFKKKFCKINGSTRLISGESFKFFLQNKYAVFFLMLIVFSVFNCFGQEEYTYSSKSDYIYKIHMEYLEGEVTTDKLNYIKEKENYIKKLESKLNNSEFSDGMMGVITNTIENESNALYKIKEQYNRIKMLKQQGIEACFVDENVYGVFVSDPRREWMSFAFLSLILIVSIPSINTCEYKNNVICLIRSNKNGKLKLWLTKVMIGLFSTILSFICAYIPYIIRFINTYSLKCFSYPLNVIEMFESGKTISILGALYVELISYLFVAILVFSLVTFIAVVTKNNLISMLLSTVVIFIPAVVLNRNENLRAGNIFESNFIMPMVIIITICLILAVLFITLAGKRFTGTGFTQLRRSYETGN